MDRFYPLVVPGYPVCLLFPLSLAVPRCRRDVWLYKTSKTQGGLVHHPRNRKNFFHKEQHDETYIPNQNEKDGGSKAQKQQNSSTGHLIIDRQSGPGCIYNLREGAFCTNVKLTTPEFLTFLLISACTVLGVLY